MNDNDQNFYMQLAVEQAEIAGLNDDVPVGAIIVHNNQVIAKAYNRRQIDHNAIAHAEILAIQEACQKLNRWILDDCQLFVTLEPCVMCFGAIVQARIQDVYFGAYDPKTGACGSLSDLRNLKSSSINHHTCFHGGILLEVCSEQIKTFFKKKRLEKSRDNGMEIS